MGVGSLFLLASLCLACGASSWPNDYSVTLKDGDEFEYIVVGAGAGGAAAAARLAAGGLRVLLVEAGGDPSLLTRIPGTAQVLLGSDVDWQYPTVANGISCLSSEGGSCRFSRGKCLGGSTSINYMMYTRPNPADFDRWNVSNWSWEDLKPYFFRFEALHALDQLPATSIPYHNTTGNMDLEFFADSENSWHERLITGLQELNFPFNPDVNAKSQIGVTQVVGYVYKNERMSTARGYLANDEFTKKPLVVKNTVVTRVIIDDDGVARGVSVLSGYLKMKMNLYVTKEVILSAGTIGTPQILLSSGIGPADHLQAFDISVQSDLPVGEGMTDHVLPLIVLKVDRGFGTNFPNIFTFGEKGTQVAEWLLTKTGPLASDGLTDVSSFCNIDCYDFKEHRLRHEDSSCELPNMQFIFAYIDRGIIPGVEALVQQAINFNADIVDQFSEANVHQGLIVVSPVQLLVHSQGSVRLASADPQDLPAIYPNYLDDERDMVNMLKSIKILEDLVNTTEFKENNASILKLRLRGCPAAESAGGGESDEYWRCYVRHMTYSVFHAVGTARLGRVVDGRLRVRGVRGLRVADASVVPELPRSNTAALVVALGERLADFVLEDHW